MTSHQKSPGIGHNSSAIGAGWRRFAWKKARKELVAAGVPLEIVRIRVRRAQRLGLTYPQYASVPTDSMDTCLLNCIDQYPDLLT